MGVGRGGRGGEDWKIGGRHGAGTGGGEERESSLKQKSKSLASRSGICTQGLESTLLHLWKELMLFLAHCAWKLAV